MSDLDRIREKQADTAEVIQGDVPDPRRLPVTPAETPAALAAFAAAAVQVALDTRSGDEDDYAWHDFGIPVVGVSDGLVPGTLVIETTTGHRYALAFAAAELPPAPNADPADRASWDPNALRAAREAGLVDDVADGPTYCKLHGRWETSSDDADHTPAPDPAE